MPVIFHAILCLRGFWSLTLKKDDTQSENALILVLSRGWVDKVADFNSLGPWFESGCRQFFLSYPLIPYFHFFNFLISYRNGRPHFEIGIVSAFSTVFQKAKNKKKNWKKFAPTEIRTRIYQSKVRYACL